MFIKLCHKNSGITNVGVTRDGNDGVTLFFSIFFVISTVMTFF